MRCPNSDGLRPHKLGDAMGSCHDCSMTQVPPPDYPYQEVRRMVNEMLDHFALETHRANNAMSDAMQTRHRSAAEVVRETLIDWITQGQKARAELQPYRRS